MARNHAMPLGVEIGLALTYAPCNIVAMTLDEYLTLDGKTAAQLAADANTSGATITRILYGDAQPSTEMIRAIVEATGGQVTADDLVFGAPRPKPVKAA
jgi:transcriptional regulator with XRE-family HTH domain